MAPGLRVIRLDGLGSFEKAAGVVGAYPEIWRGVVLDVGCRTQELRQALNGYPVSYIGLDIHPPADIVADLGQGIPLSDDAADIVVALDVLEHIDPIHHGFAEVCRVARRHAIIALPNASVVDARWSLVRGQMGGKYGLPLEPPSDRHRWLFTLDDARQFCRHRAEAAGWRVADEAVVAGPRRYRIAPLVKRWPNLLSPTLVTHLRPMP